MHVSTLTASDADRYRDLMLHAYESAADAFTSTADERAAQPKAWWEKRIADASGMSVALGAFQATELVGTVALEFSSKPKTRHKAHLIGMFVHERARGLGAGAALLRAALLEASARMHVRVVTLTVTQGNEPAIRLYESAGFQTFGVEPLAISTPGGFKSKVHMWLELRRGDAAA
jgi:ribosomal protein S18 acetylase RimI-like enzyme